MFRKRCPKITIVQEIHVSPDVDLVKLTELIIERLRRCNGLPNAKTQPRPKPTSMRTIP
jgi:hypothetical protein